MNWPYFVVFIVHSSWAGSLCFIAMAARVNDICFRKSRMRRVIWTSAVIIATALAALNITITLLTHADYDARDDWINWRVPPWLFWVNTILPTCGIGMTAYSYRVAFPRGYDSIGGNVSRTLLLGSVRTTFLLYSIVYFLIWSIAALAVGGQIFTPVMQGMVLGFVTAVNTLVEVQFKKIVRVVVRQQANPSTRGETYFDPMATGAVAS
ncbi:hypothetical protein H9P43_005815 [Blastocladiella emersonii ATCC 22665]|nr:hypothetical protein H9P43_005815 [Blastocladiella emersonii ATCC 22665]